MNEKRQGKFFWHAAMLLTLVLALCFAPDTQAASKIKLNKTSITLNKGKTYKLKVKGTSKKVTWSSSKKSVASVTKSGKVSAKKAGTAYIYAKVGKKKLKCKVTVKQPVTSVTLNKSSMTVTAGKTKKLTVTVKPSNASNQKLVWSSSDRSVATVNYQGKVTGKKAGTVTITVKALDGSGKKATCKVKVKKKTSTASTTTTSAVATQTTSGVAQKLLASLEKFSQQVQADYAAGNYWTYNSKQYLTWEKAKLGRTFDCAQIANLALRDIGVIPTDVPISSYSFWDTSSGFGTNGKYYNSSGVYIGEVYDDGFYIRDYTAVRSTVISTRQLFENCGGVILTVNQTVADLIAEGNLLPGDICAMKGEGHTIVYAGNGCWYDAGRSGLNGYKSGSTYIFTTLGPVKMDYMNSRVVVQIIRFTV